MPAVAALLDTRAALVTLRRTLAGDSPSVVACRSVGALYRACSSHLLDAVVVGRRKLDDLDLERMRRQYPSIPMVVYGFFRPDDGTMLQRLVEQGGVAALMVEGVDDPMVGTIVRRHSLSRSRAEALSDAPRLLRLTEPLQQEAWHALLSVAGRPVQTEEVATVLGVSREHLSRQFAAGGAPNLKRVIDLLRIVCACQLLANPGHSIRSVSDVLGFATPSHFRGVAKRIVGAPADRLRSLGIQGAVRAFLRAGTRSLG